MLLECLRHCLEHSPSRGRSPLLSSLLLLLSFSPTGLLPRAALSPCGRHDSRCAPPNHESCDLSPRILLGAMLGAMLEHLSSIRLRLKFPRLSSLKRFHQVDALRHTPIGEEEPRSHRLQSRLEAGSSCDGYRSCNQLERKSTRELSAGPPTAVDTGARNPCKRPG